LERLPGEPGGRESHAQGIGPYNGRRPDPATGKPGATRATGSGRGASGGRGRFPSHRHGPGACDRPASRWRPGRPIPGPATRGGVNHRGPHHDRPDTRDR
jgi:hypothetical protein